MLEARWVKQATPWQRTEIEQSAFGRFVKQAQRYPDAIAVQSHGGPTNYNQLLTKSLCVAARITASRAPVIILLEASAECAAAMLACLAVGRPYCMLDPEYPTKQNIECIKRSAADVVLTRSDYVPLLQSYQCGLSVVDVAGGVDAETSVGNQTLLLKQLHTASADDDAYIYYTSGSTGEPKGVYQNQRGLLHDVWQYSEAIAASHTDCFSWLYSPAVLGAARDVFGALFNGGCLIAMHPRQLGFSGIADCVKNYNISIFHAIPALLRAFLHSKPDPAVLSSVRLAYVAGDRFFADDVGSFYQHFSSACIIYNGIGATECSTLYRQWYVTSRTIIQSSLVPVGFAVPDKQTMLVDDEGNTVATGEVGEVVVISQYLAKGYWHNDKLTAQSFVVVNVQDNTRRYRTGDLARELPDGCYEFLGRTDSQVKIRGYRVVLALLEAQLRQMPGVIDAAAFVWDDSELVVALCGATRAFSEIKQQLLQLLPAEYQPKHFLKLESIPRLPNYKVDSRALKALFSLQMAPVAHSGDLSQQVLSEQVALLWRELLKCNHDNQHLTFAQLGGDSLTAMTLLVELEKLMGKLLPVDIVHQKQTLSELVNAVTDSESHYKPQLYIVPPINGFPGVVTFARALAEHVNVHMLPLTLLYNAQQEPQRAITVIADTVVDYLQANSKQQPIHLIALSGGVRVAHEVACKLAEKNSAVGCVFMADSGPKLTLKALSTRYNVDTWQDWKPAFYRGNITELIALRDSHNKPKPLKALGWQLFCQHTEEVGFDSRHGDVLVCAFVQQYVISLIRQAEKIV